MDKKFCDNCEFRRKLKFTTICECLKYNVILEGNPPICCGACCRDSKSTNVEEPQPKPRSKKKNKEYIEVK